jgi:hypothetical protein
MSDEYRAMNPGDSVKVSEATAKCIAAHGRYVGWKTRRQLQDDGKVRIWRIS